MGKRAPTTLRWSLDFFSDAVRCRWFRILAIVDDSSWNAWLRVRGTYYPDAQQNAFVESFNAVAR